MKLVLPLATFLLVLSLSACKKDGVRHFKEYEKSLDAWKDFKASSHNSYSYKVLAGSWIGINTETVITIQNGQVVGRDYIRIYYRQTPAGVQPDTLAWKETASQIGAHQQGAAAMTLDEIYHEARVNWLKHRDDADTYFEAKNNGMISEAGYIPNNCQDDCFIGIHIKEIRAL